MIQSPKDIKNKSVKELEGLAKEIRTRIIDVLSKTGGHLASNLGVVELTIALHKCFDSPRDKFIWDVSHQTYVHKLLTGRNDRFETIRQYGGLCGFSHPAESEYDHFHAGHAGTALSLALGCQTNRDLNGDDYYVVPIIGDATFTCGMALEALNNLGRDRKKLVIILNDNRMSISKNVGNITKLLSRLISNPFMHRIHQKFDHLLKKLPLGSRLVRYGRKLSKVLKNLLSSAALLEHFGLSYIGPINGHDIGALIDVFEGVKDSDNPVLIHVVTNKGEGLPEAVRSPTTHHGAKPFDKVTGKFLPTPKKPTFPKIFGDQMIRMAKEDPSLVAVTPAMSFGSCLDGMIEEFPNRVFDVGIAESHAVTYSGGLAYGGKLNVVCSIYATFLQRALDNLFHDVCLQRLPVVFAIDRGGISGPDGSTHHGIYDISFLRAMPNMVITQPRDGKVLRELMLSAFSWKKPTAIRYPNLATDDSIEDLTARELGKGELLAEGSDLLLIPLGHMNKVALEVRENLINLGTSASVFDPVFVKPLDTEALDQLLKTHKKVVTLEEHSVTTGLGAAVNEYLTQKEGVKVLNLGIPDRFLEHGANKDLLDEIGLTPHKITNSILQHFKQEVEVLWS